MADKNENEKTEIGRIFFRGLFDVLPFMLVLVPFGTLFGVVATEAGWDIYQVMSASFLVIAGASQFTAVALWTENAPLFFILLASLAVNLRMAMYSAALVPHFGRAPLGLRALLAYMILDQNFVQATAKFEDEPDLKMYEKIAYFIGMFLGLAPVWYASTYAGAKFGGAIPEAYALDFAIPILFIAVIAPGLRKPPHIVAAIVSIVFSLLLANVPHSMGVLIAAALAMMAGAETERRIEARKS